MNLKKITFILENFYPAHRAGTETYVLNLAKGLLSREWEVSVIIAAVGKESHNYEYEGIKIFALSVPNKISTQELNGLKNPSNLITFKNIINQLSSNIIHFHSFSRSFTHFHLKEAYNFGAKVFFTAHLGGIFCVRGDLLLHGKRTCNAKVQQLRCTTCYAKQKYSNTKALLGGWATLLLSNTPFITQKPSLNLVSNKKMSLEYLQKYTHQCVAIANWIEAAYHINHIPNTTIITQAIDTSKFTRTKQKETNSKLKLGFIGRMNPSKGAHVLLEALYSNDLYKKIDLEIITIRDVSEVGYYTTIKEKFKTLAYSQWTENVSHSEINLAMNDWDFLVLPSYHEVAPLTILEANAKGIPVIGSDYVAIAEMIQHNQNGLLFKNGDSKGLALILEQWVDSPSRVDELSRQIKKVKDVQTLIEEHLSLYS